MERIDNATQYTKYVNLLHQLEQGNIAAKFISENCISQLSDICLNIDNMTINCYAKQFVIKNLIARADCETTLALSIIPHAIRTLKCEISRYNNETLGFSMEENDPISFERISLGENRDFWFPVIPTMSDEMIGLAYEMAQLMIKYYSDLLT